MVLFHPRKVSRLRAWLDARRGVKAGRPLPAYLADKLAVAERQAPRAGTPPYALTIQDDGSVLRMPPKVEPPDPLALPLDSDLRIRRGAAAAEELRRCGAAACEEISRCEKERRTLDSERHELVLRQRAFIQAHPVAGRLARVVWGSRLGFMILSAGEVAALGVLFADWFGVDIAQVDLLFRHPVEAFAVLVAATGVFMASVMLALKALDRDHPRAALAAGAALVIGGIGLGWMRGAQIPESSWEQAVIFMVVTIALPVAAAVLKRRAAEAAAVQGAWRKLEREGRELGRRLTLAERRQQVAEGELATVVAEYTMEYMLARAVEARVRNAWLRWLQATEASLAEYRLAYLGRSARTRGPRADAASIVKAASLLLLINLAAASCAEVRGHEHVPVHAILLCDRSSSAAELSCSANTVLGAGRWWADEATLGGTFEVWLVGDGIDIPRLVSETYPEHFRPPVSESKRAWRQAFEGRLGGKSGTLPTNTGSAIAEAFWRVSRRLNEAGPGRKVLILASDLRQVTPGRWDFERRIPRTEEFLVWLRESDLTPDFGARVELVVCGFHSSTPAGTSLSTAVTYRRTRALWQDVFTAWGVKARIEEDCFRTDALKGDTP
jgi:hypothetical protein